MVLVEHDGPWGEVALRDARLDAPVRAHLSGHRGLKVLLVRRHRRPDRLGGCRVFVWTPGRSLLTASFERHADLLDLDVAAVARREAPAGLVAHPDPVYAVCTHGRHDACCAERGRPVARALSEVRPDQTWEVSHMGGDRYAGNLLVLPHGLYYGRVTPETAPGIAAAYDRGEVDLAHLRGRSSRPMAVQYAEIALRRHLEEPRLAALRLVARDDATTEWQHGDTRWRVRVSRSLGAPDQLTCGAARLNPVPSYAVEELTRLA